MTVTDSHGTDLFQELSSQELSKEQELLKRQIYEKMSHRRRKFVDRIGYEQWDPFQAPNEPLDMRRDATRRTAQELVREFSRAHSGREKSPAWLKGAQDCALAVIIHDERYQGIYDFCLWYHELLQKEGMLPPGA